MCSKHHFGVLDTILGKYVHIWKYCTNMGYYWWLLAGIVYIPLLFRVLLGIYGGLWYIPVYNAVFNRIDTIIRHIYT